MNKFLHKKNDIISWLNDYEISGYNLIEDAKYSYIVDIVDRLDQKGINLAGKNLSHIPVKFNVVDASFDCSENQLNSLEFAPKIVTRSFYCANNKLTSLKFCPYEVGVHFSCRNNELTTLEFCPVKFGANYKGSFFTFSSNKVKSLEFCPKIITGNLHGSYNDLSFDGLMEFAPDEVGWDFRCHNNPKLGRFQNVEDFKEIKKEILLFKSKIKSIHDMKRKLDSNLMKNEKKSQIVKI